MKSIFIGTRIEALKAVASRLKIDLVITNKNSFIDKYIYKKKYKIFYFNKNNLPQVFELFKKSKAKLIFSSGFPFIIPKKYLLKNKIFINSHPSLLPKYKGYRPVIDALKNNENIIGVSVHYIDESLDGGKIICKKKFRLNKIRDVKNIYKQLFTIIEPQAIIKALDKILKYD